MGDRLTVEVWGPCEECGGVDSACFSRDCAVCSGTGETPRYYGARAEDIVAHVAALPDDKRAALLQALAFDRPVASVVRDRIPHADVASDRELLREALLALRPDAGEKLPRWSLVRSALKHGSGVGTAICDALEIDGDEVVAAELPEWVRELVDDAP